MGEYAKRKSDGQEIKIGTCEDMYYIRFEDRFKVSPLDGNTDISREPEGCRFRLPFPDEDNILPGDYEDFNRGLRLYKRLPCDWCAGSGKNLTFAEDCRRCGGNGFDGHSDFQYEDLKPGSFQITHESGLLFSVPCHHGMKLPDLGPVKPCWNGKSWATVLSSIRVVRDGLELKTFPVVRCRFCDEAWRFDWEDVWDYIPEDMKTRLQRYREVLV
jgi:hypothetical protein